jgi:hypothetical protein
MAVQIDAAAVLRQRIFDEHGQPGTRAVGQPTMLVGVSERRDVREAYEAARALLYGARGDIAEADQAVRRVGAAIARAARGER